jgi:hypothetical protein
MGSFSSVSREHLTILLVLMAHFRELNRCSIQSTKMLEMLMRVFSMN